MLVSAFSLFLVSLSFFRCNALNQQGDYTRITDDSDRCCRVHSDCYRGVATNCEPAILNNYDFIFHKGTVSCLDRDGTCEYSVCLCDKQMAECLKKYHVKYDEQRFGNLTKTECQRK
jgi:hypothetical protein